MLASWTLRTVFGFGMTGICPRLSRKEVQQTESSSFVFKSKHKTECMSNSIQTALSLAHL